MDPEDVIKCEERYNKAKAVHSVLRHVAEVKGLKLEHLYQKIGWPLYRKYGHAYDGFKIALKYDCVECHLIELTSFVQSCSDSEDGGDIFADLDIEEDVKSALVTYIKRRLAPQPVKIRADIEVTCFTYEGIDAIKEALAEGEAKGTADAPVRIKLIAPPMYVMTSMTLDKDLGVETMNAAIEAIAATVKAKG